MWTQEPFIYIYKNEPFFVKMTCSDPGIFKCTPFLQNGILKTFLGVKPAHYKLYSFSRNLEISGNHELAKI